MHALTRGDLRTAAHDNLLVLVGGTAAVLVWAHWAYRSARGLRTRLRAPGRAWTVALVAAVIAFTVLRNTPAGAPLAP